MRNTAFVYAVSACPVRCSRGRTTAPTPVGEARTQSRGRRLHQSSQALSSGTRLSPRRRRPKSPARLLPSSPPAPRGRYAALILFDFVFSWLCAHSALVALFSCSSGHLSLTYAVDLFLHLCCEALTAVCVLVVRSSVNQSRAGCNFLWTRLLID